MAGLTNTVFAPDNSLTRGQFAAILYRLDGEPEVTYNNVFPDIPEGQWFTNAVLWASNENIVNGYGDTGLFGPDDNITREQMAVMMYHYAKHQNYDVSSSISLDNYKDFNSVSDYALKAMEWAVGNNIITGKNSSTLLDPQGDATRAECSVIIKQFMDIYTAQF